MAGISVYPECLLAFGPVELSAPWLDYAHQSAPTCSDEQLVAVACSSEAGQLGSHRASRAAWAALHAWRWAGQQQLACACQPLVDVLSNQLSSVHDIRWHELPQVLAMIGRPALRPLAKLLADSHCSDEARAAAGTSLRMMVDYHSPTRSQVIHTITDQLGRYRQQSSLLNAYLVELLLDLRASDSLNLIRSVYRARRIDRTLASAWPQVQAMLELPLVIFSHSLPQQSMAG